ncbi:hypothetical protein RFI_16730 [Reticulomyxa filosa]|uniref:Transmembrane protein n=1 Tax=Reticulomyxa filosa TaxID=46433 RepID=X6N5A2_RETFI|nr:hypothetical protein RFI_16730 [Reticulomyxa filosa]|eukprot:ETO20487.1 hypothetical protein RFI_16730 [Reticulomyxa filosa]
MLTYYGSHLFILFCPMFFNQLDHINEQLIFYFFVIFKKKRIFQVHCSSQKFGKDDLTVFGSLISTNLFRYQIRIKNDDRIYQKNNYIEKYQQLEQAHSITAITTTHTITKKKKKQMTMSKCIQFVSAGAVTARFAIHCIIIAIIKFKRKRLWKWPMQAKKKEEILDTTVIYDINIISSANDKTEPIAMTMEW